MLTAARAPLALLAAGAFAGAVLWVGARPVPAAAQGWCQPGARVAAASYGHWYKATVLKPDGTGKCWVHYDGYSASSEEAVTRDNIGPIKLADQYDHPEAAAAAAGGGGGGARAVRLVATSYTCTGFIGPVGRGGHIVPMPGITILAGGRYRHAGGGGGTVTARGGTAEFHGGPLDGQAASYDAGPDGRRGNLHLYNQQRTRTVIDCDGHG